MNRILYKVYISVLLLTVLFTLLTGCSSEIEDVNTEQTVVTYVENEDFQNFLGNESTLLK